MSELDPCMAAKSVNSAVHTTTLGCPCRCVSADVDKYGYEVCFYGAAAQKDGGMSTSLGSFARFENNFSTMVYEGGQGCWSGPPRSIRVRHTRYF